MKSVLSLKAKLKSALEAEKCCGSDGGEGRKFTEQDAESFKSALMA